MAKKQRKMRTKSTAPGADIGDNSGDEKPILTPDEERALFLQHRGSWNEWQAKMKVVEQFGRDVKAALKSDGFTAKQMQIADQLADPKGEAKVKAEVKDRLQVAAWLGHPMGAQLDLFGQPDRLPAVDRAYDEGKMCSMQDKPARPPYDPSTPQYEHFMAGYHDHQREIVGGMKAPRSADESTMANRD